MKKVFTLLWSVLALLMVTNTMQAQENYTLYFGQMTDGDGRWSLFKGSTLTEINEYTGNSGKWSAEANKLTLNGFTFETSSTPAALYMPTASTLTLTEGTVNTIRNTTTISASGIYAYNTFTINGSGSLEVSVGNENEGSEGDICAIQIRYGKLCIDGANLTATAFNSTSGSSEGIGGGATGVEIKNGAIVTVSAGTSASYPSYSVGILVGNLESGLTVTDDCVVKVQGHTYAVNCMGDIPDPKNIPIYASEEYNGTGASLGKVVIYEYEGSSEYMIDNNNARWVQIGGTLPVDHTLYFRNGALRTSNDDAGTVYDGEGITYEVNDTKITFTLNNFNFTTTAATGLDFSSITSGELAIELVGENTITSGASSTSATYGIKTNYEDVTLSIAGPGSLTVNAGECAKSYTDGSLGIYTATLIVGDDTNSTVLNINAGNSTAEYSSSAAIQVEGNMTVKGNATVNATAGTATNTSAISNGIYVLKELSVQGSANVTAVSKEASESSNGVRSNNITMSGGEITATSSTAGKYGAIYVTLSPENVIVKGGDSASDEETLTHFTNGANLYVFGIDTTPAKYAVMTPAASTTPDYTLYFGKGTDEKWSLWKDDALSEEYTGNMGRWEAAENELTLNGFTFETTAPTAVVIPDDITIQLEDGTTNSITSTYNESTSDTYAIDAKKSVTINGNTGSLSVAAGTASKLSGYSVGIKTLDKLTINGGNINATSVYGQAYPSGIAVQEFLMTNGTMTITGGMGYYSYGMYISGTNVTISGGTVTTTGGNGTASAGIYMYNTEASISVTGSGQINATGGTKAISMPNEPNAAAVGTADGTTQDPAAASWDAATTTYLIDGSTAKYIKLTIKPNIPVTGITVAPTTLAMGIKDTKQLTATFDPIDATNRDVTWASDNEAVATVSATGLVTAVSEGTATITVKTEDGDFTDECEITVTNSGGGETGTTYTISLEVADGIELNGLTAGDLSVNEGGHLHLQFLPEDRTLGAADILFLVDGVETEFTELGENNFFSYILNPVTQDHMILVALKEYPVILPEVEGVTYDVGAGMHQVGYGEKFTFILTLAEGIDPEKVHVYANGREILPDALRSVVLTYTIDKVLTPITVVIEGAGDPITGNGNIAHGDIQLRIMNYELQIINSAATAVDVNVYTVQGKNIVQLRGLRGSKTVRLQPGIYIVKAGSEVFKVSVN